MSSEDFDRKAVLDTLNRALELELAGVVRYMHYSFMIFGYHRIPIVNWMRAQATESMDHAARVGEHVTSLGGHPSLEIGELLETHRHGLDHILGEAVDHEKQAIAEYRTLLGQVEGRSVLLEEFARAMVAEEESHVAEIEKMLRKPGE
jgi:bacterioferritin